MKKKYTIYDVARISGFSPKTVSRVINGGAAVKPETHAKIQKVIDELSYTPNLYARNLTRKETTNILISVKKMDSFPLIWFQTLLDKLLKSCKDLGLNAIVEYFGENEHISDTIIYSSGSLVDGVIIFYEEEDDVRIDYLRKNKVPFIVFGKSFQPDVVCVNNKDYQSLYDLMEYFVEKNHKSVWLLMGGTSLVNIERERGVRDYLRFTDNTEVDVEVFYGLSTIESVYDFVIENATTNHLPDAIFVSGDEKVQGLIKALQEKGLSIPGDVAVVGYDNIPISKFYTPALSTISPDYQELSLRLLNGLTDLIAGHQVESVEVPTTFIERESSR